MKNEDSYFKYGKSREVLMKLITMYFVYKSRLKLQVLIVHKHKRNVKQINLGIVDIQRMMMKKICYYHEVLLLK